MRFHQLSSYLLPYPFFFFAIKMCIRNLPEIVTFCIMSPEERLINIKHAIFTRETKLNSTKSAIFHLNQRKLS